MLYYISRDTKGLALQNWFSNKMFRIHIYTSTSHKSYYIKKEYKINFVKVLRFPLFADCDV